MKRYANDFLDDPRLESEKESPRERVYRKMQESIDENEAQVFRPVDK